MRFSDVNFESIVKAGNRSMLYRNVFNVNWIISRYCNYSCSYCWPYANTKVKDHRPIEVIKTIIDSIFQQAKERGYDDFSFSFSGGEPTLHPNFLEIIRHISTENTRVIITTNLSKNIKWLSKLIEIPKTLAVTASFHPEFADREKFIKRVKFLKESGAITQVNVVLVKNKFDEMWNHAKYIYDQGVAVQVKIEVDYSNNTTTLQEYTNYQMEKIKNGLPRATKNYYTYEMIDSDGNSYSVDNAERVIGLEYNRFEGWFCEAGYRSIIIHEPTGLIKRHYLCNDQPIGHIETGFKLYETPKICTTEICGSSADCKIPKYKEIM